MIKVMSRLMAKIGLVGVDNAAREVVSADNLAYEDARDLARHPDPSIRQRLAARKDLRPEVLYYLAEDDCSEVRREIVANELTPAKAHLLLAHDRDERVRCDLAYKIARLTPELSPEEQNRLQQVTYEILEILARDQLVRVRQILAETLKDVASAPPGVVKRLAMDTELSVAAPVLEFSPLLTDDDILEIITCGPVQGALSAISRRPMVSAQVSDAIVDCDDIPAITRLLANPSAQIREETLDMLVERSAKVKEWQSPLVHRSHLPVKAVKKLASFVANALLEVLQARSDLDPETLREVALVVHRRLEAQEPEGHHEFDDLSAVHSNGGLKDGRPLSEHVQLLDAEGRLDEGAVDEALGGGNHGFVTEALALKAGVSALLVDKVVSAHSAKGITALAWKAGFGMRFAVKLQTRFAHIGPRDIINAHNGIEYPLSEDEMEWLIEFFGS